MVQALKIDGTTFVTFVRACQVHFTAMPILALEPAQQQAAWKAIDDDSDYLLTSKGVDRDIIGVISHIHVRTIGVFKSIDGTEAGVRAWIHDDIGTKPADGIASRATYPRAPATERCPFRVHCPERRVGVTHISAQYQLS